MASRADDFEFRNELAATLENERLADQIVERLPMVPVENLATKDDLDHLRVELLGKFGELRGEFGELRGEFGELRGEFGELRGEFGELRGELRGELHELRAEMVAMGNDLRAEMHRSTQSMIKWVAGLVFPTLVTGIGASAAITAAIVG